MIFANPLPALTFLAALASPVPVQMPATPAPARALDSLAYDDPGMHFRAPEGWARIPLATAPDGGNDKRPPAALFVLHPGKIDQRSIVIDIQPFEGTLDGFESSRESELRSSDSGTFVDHKIKTALGNGMPAFFITVSQPGGDVGHQLKRYDYLVYDLSRSIDVGYIGRYGDFSEADAKAALADLSVVVFPRRRS